MIIIAAPNDFGKSSLLRAVIKTIKWELVKYNNTWENPVEIKECASNDCIAIGITEHRTKKVGIATFGDTPGSVKSNLAFFIRHSCDIIVLATHTGEKESNGFFIAKQFAEQREYKLYVTSPITEWSQKGKVLTMKEELNNLQASVIEQLIRL